MIHANVLLDKVYSTVGSGDCLLAGIIAGHYLKMKDLNIAKLGVACGAANCLNKDLGMLKRSDVNLLNRKVVLAILKNQSVIS